MSVRENRRFERDKRRDIASRNQQEIDSIFGGERPALGGFSGDRKLARVVPPVGRAGVMTDRFRDDRSGVRSSAPGPRYQGAVKWFSAQKGYGFIIPDGGGSDNHFVHANELKKTGIADLPEGQRVDYALKEAGRGRTSATDVKVL